MRALLVLGGTFLLGCSAPEFNTDGANDSGTPDGIGVQDGAFPDVLADVLADASADASADVADSASGCVSPANFDLPVDQDTFLNGDDPSKSASINYGAAKHLLVGSTVPLTVALFRFASTKQVADAITEQRVLSMNLTVATADAGASPTAGKVRVFFMRTDWTEGTETYDGATWAQRIATCSGCTSGPDNACCDYTEEWNGPGASGVLDRAQTPAATATLPSGGATVVIPLDVSGAGQFGTTVGVQIVPENPTKVWLAGIGETGPATLTGTYCQKL
jgi:hypothetical protein